MGARSLAAAGVLSFLAAAAAATTRPCHGATRVVIVDYC